MKLYIARLKVNLLYAYKDKPKVHTFRNGDKDFVPQGAILELPEEWFSSVTFENSPQQVEIKLIENE